MLCRINRGERPTIRIAGDNIKIIPEIEIDICREIARGGRNNLIIHLNKLASGNSGISNKTTMNIMYFDDDETHIQKYVRLVTITEF